MPGDLLEEATWRCCSTAADAAPSPDELTALSPDWFPAQIPGTAASACRSSDPGRVATEDFDASDWWWATTVSSSARTARLELEGLATVADVFVNGVLVHHSENMFRAASVPVALRDGENEIAICCRALAPLIRQRRPRPRWRTRLVEHQALRWYRTTLLGRIPGWAGSAAPVGPWRPIRLLPEPAVRIRSSHVSTRLDGEDGIVELTLQLEGDQDQGPLSWQVGTVSGPLQRDPANHGWARGSLRLSAVEPWWPHTHGTQTLYPLTVSVGAQEIRLSPVGFRSLEIDHSDGGFGIVVNGVPVFSRGACWMPLDPVSLQAGREALRDALDLVVRANLNLVRVPGTMVYEEQAFYELCDELGILVWQDCMFANFDPPDDPVFESEVVAEITDELNRLSGHPSLAVLSGGSEIEQQAAMVGLGGDDLAPRLMEETLRKLAASLVPGVVYVTSTPTGGDPPFRSDVGIAHYFGVGAYLRDLGDARRASVRFAAECLAFAVPPEPETIEEAFGDANVVGHDPRWKRAVPRDSATAWDFEDVTTHYVRDFFGVDPIRLRYGEPERWLDLSRAAAAECVRSVFSEWRRPGSGCAGGIVLTLRDLVPGAGWGLIDALGRPKSSWFAIRRTTAPVAVLGIDEGLNGHALHVLNDRPTPLRGTLEIALTAGARTVEQAVHELEVEPHGSVSLSAESALGGFRDVNYAYRFGPPNHDALVATLRGDDGAELSQYVHLPLGFARDVSVDLGLHAELRESTEGSYEVEVSTEQLAEFVALDVPGFVPEDSWFHLVPGHPRRLRLLPLGATGRPAGRVRAVNGRNSVAIGAATVGAGR